MPTTTVVGLLNENCPRCSSKLEECYEIWPEDDEYPTGDRKIDLKRCTGNCGYALVTKDELQAWRKTPYVRAHSHRHESVVQ